ncbi:MAG: cell division protein FtsZ, partial [Muricauda sp.]|nr:cell division protein FtsZ [Allomuricauda sp.]
VTPEPKASNPDLIPTSSYIRNFNVFYEEVVAENVEDDFIIIEAKNILNNIEVVEPEVVSPKTNEDQFALSFDMPLNEMAEEEEKEHTITFNLDDGLGDVKVNEFVEVKPVLEYKKEGETRYNLEEYMELENKLTGAKSMAETHEPKLVENELVFEKKTIKMESAEQTEASNADLDPMNSSISEILKDRADERRRKLKNFNYKFQNNRSSIDEIEKQPAYKRQGVDLNDVPREQKVSRTTLGEDSNDDLQLRSNNSFLHDNVD